MLRIIENFFSGKFNIKIGKNNIISSTAIIQDNVVIGDNNNIGDNVIIYNNVIIGDGNKLSNNVVIHSNVEIGNNNHFFPRNIIGEMCPSTNEEYSEYRIDLCKGVIIGNDNIFHVDNGILCGFENKTIIGDSNIFLGHVYLAHDVIVKNNVTFYPNIYVSGSTVCLSYSNIGLGCMINQRMVIGQYSMSGNSSGIVKNVFPYYIFINNKLHRLNNNKIPEYVKQYDAILREIYKNFNENNYDITKYSLPHDIQSILIEYVKNILLLQQK